MSLAKRGMSKGEGKGQRGRLPSESEIQEDINYLARHYALDAAPELMTIMEDSYRKALGNTATATPSQSAAPATTKPASVSNPFASVVVKKFPNKVTMNELMGIFKNNNVTPQEQGVIIDALSKADWIK